MPGRDICVPYRDVLHVGEALTSQQLFGDVLRRLTNWWALRSSRIFVVSGGGSAASASERNPSRSSGSGKRRASKKSLRLQPLIMIG